MPPLAGILHPTRLAALLALGLAPITLFAAPQPPADSQWRLASIATLDTLDPRLTTLVVDGDGNLSGMAGCNNYRRDWQGDGYAEIAVTRKMCADDRMRQETAFLDVLRQTTDWKTGDRRLVLRDAEGTRLAMMLEPITRRYHFVCGEETIRFDVVGDERIRLTHADGTLDLKRVPSASGSRYESEDGKTVFWGKGTQGRFEVNQETRECRQVPNPQ